MNYLKITEVISFHDEVILHSGGMRGYDLKRLAYLESALEQVKNDTYYPSMVSKVGHLMFACIKFHPFLDGNKRTSIYLAMVFLECNLVGVQDFA